MCAETSNSGQVSSQEAYNGPQAANKDANPQISRALDKLRLAAESRRVEPICKAYQALREAAGEMDAKELLKMADEALDQPATGLIVSAYSHRRCFMCKNGTVKCDQCRGTGLVEEDRLCPHCDGAKVIACGFCGGTGWTDRNTVPAELKRTILRRQLKHVQEDLKKLAGASSELTAENIRKLPDEERRSLTSWLIRLQARLIDLGGAGLVSEDEQIHMRGLADKIGVCLDLLHSGS